MGIWSTIFSIIKRERYDLFRGLTIVTFVFLTFLSIYLDFAYPAGSQWVLVNSRTGRFFATGLINLAPELAGIVVGVFSIDFLNNYRQDQLLKKQLIFKWEVDTMT